MVLIRLLLYALAGYVVIAGVLWLVQDRLAFPAPRAALPDPATAGLPDAEPFALTMSDGTRLAGWFLPPAPVDAPVRAASPGLLWFYGNGENIAALAPVLREFRPPGTGLLVVDYPGYGASGGRAREGALYEAADLAYEALVAQRGTDPTRIFIYGRSLGSVVAIHVAAAHHVAGLILESPLTSARELAARAYPFLPRFLVRLRLDNLTAITRVHCPVLVLLGTADRVIPPDMGRRIAAAASGPTKLMLIEGADHNDTYDVGGRAYRDAVWAFLR
jgi:fermentation-respiration switch protein FrsA (DUF1100 family)